MEESFSDGLLEHPQYTRPREWEGRAIPDVLLGGDHAKIEAWRRAERERISAACKCASRKAMKARQSAVVMPWPPPR